MEDNSLKMKHALQQHLYQLRIEAEVKVVELDATDVSAYTYERTLIMEQRNQLIRNLKMNKKQGTKKGDVTGLLKNRYKLQTCTCNLVKFHDHFFY